MKKLLCLILCGVLLVSGTAFAAGEEIDYPHFMYSMEAGDFGGDFNTPGKYYESLPIIVPGYISDSEDSYILSKSETNEYVNLLVDGYAGANEHSYATLVNAVEAYFGAEAAQLVRSNFDYTEFHVDGKMDAEAGEYSFTYIAGNNHRGFSLRVRREPIFIDLVGNDSFEVNDVIALFGEGVIKGMGGGIFAPDANITRAQFAAMFTRLIGAGEVGYKGVFADVPDGTWYTGAVEAIADMDYVLGYGDGKFHPDDRISYQDMFLVAYRYLNDNDLLPEESKLPQPFDISRLDGIADYAEIAMVELHARSLINYDYIENAGDPGTRIHIAAFLNGVRVYAKGMRGN